MDPSESELIELENAVLFNLERSAQSCDAFTRNDRVLRTLRRLIAIARESTALPESPNPKVAGRTKP